MRYDFINLYSIRYPGGDDAMLGVIKIAAIADSALQVNGLVCALNDDEIQIDVLKPYHDIVEHFKSYHPDVLIFNADEFSQIYFGELTTKLSKESFQMPFLIAITKNRTHEIEEAAGFYNGVYYIVPPFSFAEEGRRVREFLLTKIVSPEFYRKNIRQCVILTLRAMHCDPYSLGFPYLVDTVCYIIERPYFRFNYTRDIYPGIAEQYGLTVQSIDNQIRGTVTAALNEFNDYEKKVAFGEYNLSALQPTVPEFIQTAAFIASRPCKHILRNLEDEPFFRPQQRLTIY